MKVALHYRPTNRGKYSLTNYRLEAVYSAFQEAGHQMEWSPRNRPVDGSDLVITAGFQITDANRDAMDRGVPIIILENPVWHDGDRENYYTWAYNGLHGGGTVSPVEGLPTRSTPTLQPWKDWTTGRKTIFGQVPTDKAIRGHDLKSWRANVESLLPDAVYREHPIMIPSRNHGDIEPFRECLDATSLAITFTSTCGAEAVIAGIPTITYHRGSLAYPVSTHSIEETPITPDREEWLHGLSWRNWSIHEQLDVAHVLKGFEEARADALAGKYDNMSNGRPQ